MITPLLAFALYQRVPRAKALDNANRQRVYDAIRAEPGVRVGTLASRLGLNERTVRWHVRVLGRFCLVEGVGHGQRRYFASGAIRSKEEKSAIVASSAPSAKRVLSFVRAYGEVELSRIVEALGLSHSLASVSASRLERAGLVTKRREGRRVVVTLATGTSPIGQAAAKPAVDITGPSFVVALEESAGA